MHRHRPWPLATAALAAAVHGDPAAADVERLVVFGDSLSDTGNVSTLTGGAVPGEPYADGRFSNGPVWVEKLAAGLAVPAPRPSLLGGDNYAFGGAETGPGFTQFIIPNLGTQVEIYLRRGSAPGPDDLFVLLGGANDFFNGEVDPSTVVGHLVDHVRTLAEAGAASFLVATLPPLGQTPDHRAGPDEVRLDELTRAFNALYDVALTDLEASLGVTIVRFDAFDLFGEILARPPRFGLTNVTDRAYDERTGEIVPEPDLYLFWDGIHPTRVVHRIFGDRAARRLFPVDGDVTDDGVVDVEDVLEVLVRWGACDPPPARCRADLDGDGRVDVADVLIVLARWSG